MSAIDPSLCEEGHAKRDPVTKSIALRTPFSTVDYPEMSWLIATLRSGAVTRPHSYVEGWDDLHVESGGAGAGS